MLFELRKRN